MEELFPTKLNLNYNELKITEEGIYSITRKKDSEKILQFIKSIVDDVSEKSITDVTGCIGGDSLNFASEFKYVYVIELKKDNYEALKHNIKTYGFKNITAYYNDSTTFFNWYTDVLYIDPPWGGPNYRDHLVLDLFMSKKRLDNWLEEILLKENRPSYIFLKLPQNYNFSRLTFLSNVENTKPFQIRKFVLLALIISPSKNRPNPSYT